MTAATTSTTPEEEAVASSPATSKSQLQWFQSARNRWEQSRKRTSQRVAASPPTGSGSTSAGGDGHGKSNSDGTEKATDPKEPSTSPSASKMTPIKPSKTRKQIFFSPPPLTTKTNASSPMVYRRQRAQRKTRKTNPFDIHTFVAPSHEPKNLVPEKAVREMKERILVPSPSTATVPLSGGVPKDVEDVQTFSSANSFENSHSVSIGEVVKKSASSHILTQVRTLTAEGRKDETKMVGKPTEAEDDNGFTSFRNRLINFYEIHNPSKLDKVDSTLASYKGREKILFSKLEAKYIPKYPPAEGDGPVCWMKLRIDGSSSEEKIDIQLFADKAPMACENFRKLCTGECGVGRKGKPLWYKNTTFHRVVPNFCIQGGDFTMANGTGGESVFPPSSPKVDMWGNFQDEYFMQHNEKGLLSMANNGPNMNSSQFFFTLRPLPSLNGKHVVFGKVIKGFRFLEEIATVETDDKDHPLEAVTVVDCGVLEMSEGGLLISVPESQRMAAARTETSGFGESSPVSFENSPAISSSPFAEAGTLSGGSKESTSVNAEAIDITLRSSSNVEDNKASCTPIQRAPRPVFHLPSESSDKQSLPLGQIGSAAVLHPSWASVGESIESKREISNGVVGSRESVTKVEPPTTVVLSAAKLPATETDGSADDTETSGVQAYEVSKTTFTADPDTPPDETNVAESSSKEALSLSMSASSAHYKPWAEIIRLSESKVHGIGEDAKESPSPAIEREAHMVEVDRMQGKQSEYSAESTENSLLFERQETSNLSVVINASIPLVSASVKKGTGALAPNSLLLVGTEEKPAEYMSSSGHCRTDTASPKDNKEAHVEIWSPNNAPNKTEDTKEDSNKTWNDVFLADGKHWACDSCHVINKEGDAHCFACKTAKDGDGDVSSVGNTAADSACAPFASLTSDYVPKTDKKSVFNGSGFSWKGSLTATSPMVFGLKEKKLAASVLSSKSTKMPGVQVNDTISSTGHRILPVFIEARSPKAAQSGTEDTVQEGSKTWNEVFLADGDHWACSSCHVINKEGDKRCFACRTVRDGDSSETSSDGDTPVDGACAPFASITTGYIPKTDKKSVFNSGGFSWKGSLAATSPIMFGREEKPATGVLSPTHSTIPGLHIDTSLPEERKELPVKSWSPEAARSKTEDRVQEGAKTWNDVFLADGEHWACSSCHVINKEGDKRCFACKSGRDGDSNKSTSSDAATLADSACAPFAPLTSDYIPKTDKKSVFNSSGFTWKGSLAATSPIMFGREEKPATGVLSPKHSKITGLHVDTSAPEEKKELPVESWIPEAARSDTEDTPRENKIGHP